VLNYFYLYVCFDYLPPQWGLFDKTFGRADTEEADPEGRVPEWSKASVQEMKDRFVAVGLGPRQVTTTSLLDCCNKLDLIIAMRDSKNHEPVSRLTEDGSFCSLLLCQRSLDLTRLLPRND